MAKPLAMRNAGRVLQGRFASRTGPFRPGLSQINLSQLYLYRQRIQLRRHEAIACAEQYLFTRRDHPQAHSPLRLRCQKAVLLGWLPICENCQWRDSVQIERQEACRV